MTDPAPGSPGEVQGGHHFLGGAMSALIVITAAGVVLGGATVVVANNNAQYALADAAHARDISTEANGLLSAAIHTQAGLNAFLATEDPAFLDDYHLGLNAILLRSAGLHGALAGSNLPQDSDDVLQLAAADVLEDLRATLASARTEGIAEARAHLQAGRSHELTDTMRAEVTQIGLAAEEHAGDAAARSQAYARRTAVALGATAALVLISLSVLWLLLVQRSRWARQRDDLLAEVAASSLQDPLTGLGNRRALARHMALITAGAAPDIALIFVDLDAFKAVNDTCGHETGDAYLISVADHLRATVRETDFLARVGGDEFVVVVHGGERDVDPSRVTGRIRRAVSAASATCERTYGGPGIGASIGVSRRSDLQQTQRDHDVMDAMMRRADTAMYAEKRSHKARAH